MITRILFAIAVSLTALPVSAVTCNFDFQIEMPPSAVGVKTIAVGERHVAIWYPSEPSNFVQVTDEREAGRMNFGDYLWLQKFGDDFKDQDFEKKANHQTAQFQSWYTRGATKLAVTHMAAAIMHARIGAKPVPAKGVVIGTVDPVMAETLAAYGLVVVSLTAGSLDATSVPLGDALAETLNLVTAKIPDFASLPKAWFNTSPETLEQLRQVDALIQPKAYVLTHELTGGNESFKTTAPVLAFYADDTSKPMRKALKAIKSTKAKFAYMTEFETGLPTLAPYEACARKTFAKQVFQGLPLHKRRIAARAAILGHLNEALALELELAGTDLPNETLISEVGLRIDSTPKR